MNNSEPLMEFMLRKAVMRRWVSISIFSYEQAVSPCLGNTSMHAHPAKGDLTNLRVCVCVHCVYMRKYETMEANKNTCHTLNYSDRKINMASFRVTEE